MENRKNEILGLIIEILATLIFSGLIFAVTFVIMR